MVVWADGLKGGETVCETEEPGASSEADMDNHEWTYETKGKTGQYPVELKKFRWASRDIPARAPRPPSHP